MNSMDKVEILVKVGNSSDIQFNNRFVRSFRAITLPEMIDLANTNTTINVIVIEYISVEDYEEAKKFITEYTENKSNRVFFYIKSNDENTCGLADELSYPISLTLESLHRDISDYTGINVSNNINMMTIVGADDSTTLDTDDLFSTDFETDIENQDGNQDVVKAPDITEETEVFEGVTKHDNETADRSEPEQECSESIDIQHTDAVEEQCNQDKINELLKLVEAVEDERDTYKKIVETFNIDNSVMEDPITLSEYQSLLNEIESLRTKISNIEGLSESADKEIESDKNKIEGLNAQIDALNTSVIDLKQRVKAEVHNKIQLSESIEKAFTALYSTIQDLNKCKKVIDELNYKITEHENDELSNKKLIEDKELEANQYKAEADRLSAEIVRLRLENEVISSESSSEIARLSEENHKVISEMANMQSVFDNETKKFSGGLAEITELATKNKELGIANTGLKGEVLALQKDIKQGIAEKDSLEKLNKQLENVNQQLNMSIRAMSSGVRDDSTLVTECNYTGKGMVIPVFGSGSYGITTTAMSLATRLASTAKVIYIDFDMVSPKADGWFKINPIVTSVPNIDAGSEKSTGLGILVEKQVEFFMAYADSIVNSVSKFKTGRLDYISGLYTKPDSIKLAATDFTTFFNYCGNSYDYVVVDLGRLGNSSLNDQIIKMICDIAYKCIVVTTNDKFEARTFRLKIIQSKLDIEHITWLLNMCESTSLDATTKKAVSPASYGIIPFVPELYGTKTNFTKDRLTRDKFNLFIDNMFSGK